MGFQFIFLILFVVSVLTTLTVQAIKYILDTTSANYSSNILAVIVAILLSVSSVVLYCTYFEIPFSTKIGVETIVLVYLSFLVATNGYDKVMQTIRQVKAFKEGDTDE